MAKKYENLTIEELKFYGQKLRMLREKAGKSQKEMADLLGYKPPAINKVEGGLVKDIERYAGLYARSLYFLGDEYAGCEELPFLNPDSPLYDKRKADDYKKKLDEFMEQYIHIATYAMPDTNAIEHNPRIIEELLEKYHKVFIADTVITEIEFRKKYRTALQQREIAKAFNLIAENDNIYTIEADRSRQHFRNNDDRIISVAKKIVNDYSCYIHIITDDSGFKAKQKISTEISIVRLSEFLQGKYNVENMTGLHDINMMHNNFPDSINVNLRAYLPTGQTLITSAISNETLSEDEIITKVSWLCSKGADINQRENCSNFFPPITLAIQKRKYKVFEYILQYLHADPNAGSRNPYSLKMVRQQNEGNMPLMVAARQGSVQTVRMLCEHPDIILNQQDSNGFTALIKTAFHLKELKEEHGHVKGYTRYIDCCRILIKAGIDYRIIDVDGHNASYYLDEIDEIIEEL